MGPLFAKRRAAIRRAWSASSSAIRSSCRKWQSAFRTPAPTLPSPYSSTNALTECTFRSPSSRAGPRRESGRLLVRGGKLTWQQLGDRMPSHVLERDLKNSIRDRLEEVPMTNRLQWDVFISSQI